MVYSIPEDKGGMPPKPKRSSTRPLASARTFVPPWTSCTQGPSDRRRSHGPSANRSPYQVPAAHPERVPEQRRRLTWRDRALKELEDLADVMPAAGLSVLVAARFRAR